MERASRRNDIDIDGAQRSGHRGPGIIVASVARESGIIGAEFYTVLVLTAVLTSQAAGAWLGLVMRRGWKLLSDPADCPQIVAPPFPLTCSEP